MSLSISRSLQKPVPLASSVPVVVRLASSPRQSPVSTVAPRGPSLPSRTPVATAVTPAVSAPADLYAQQAPARTDQVPPLLAGLKYGSHPPARAGLITDNVVVPHVAGIIPMSVEVTKLGRAGIANVFNPEWVGVVKEAVDRNGGLGDQNCGFLAYSQQHGFVRFLNPNLTPEQNRRLAEISLVMGAPIEKLPSRTEDSALQDPKIDRWANEFIGRYDKELADFQADPTNGMSVKDGRTRYKLEVNKEAGRVVSYNFKKAGRFRAFMAKAMKYIGPIADIAYFIPGIGTAAAVGLQLFKTTGQMIANGGKFVASSIAGLVGSVLHLDPGILGLGTLSNAELALVNGGVSAGGQLIDTGKINPETILTTVAGALINDLPGGRAMDHVVQQAVVATAHAVRTGKLSPAEILPILYDILGERATGQPVSQTVEVAIRTLATAVQNGRLDLQDLVPLSQALLRGVGEDSAAGRHVKQTIQAIVEALTGGQVSADGLLNSPAAIYFKQAVDSRAA